LEALAKLLGAKAKQAEVLIEADSELIVKQLKGEYKVKDANLQKEFIKVYNLKQKFLQVSYKHIPREKNKRADELVNAALDKDI